MEPHTPGRSDAIDFTSWREFVTRLADAADPPQVYQLAYDALRSRMPVDDFVAMRFDRTAGVLRCVSAFAGGRAVDSDAFSDLESDDERNALRLQVVHSGEPLCVERPPDGNIVLVPMRRDGSTRAVMEIVSDMSGAYSTDDVNVLRFVAATCALAIHKVLLRSSVEADRSNKRLTTERLTMLSQAIEQSPVSVIIVDIDGTVEYFNTRFIELSGRPEAEVETGLPWFHDRHAIDAGVFAEIAEAIGEGRTWSGEVAKRNGRGEEYWTQARITPITEAKGRITRYLCIEEDITDQRKSKEHRRELEAQLRQSQKLQAVGSLAGGIAHDFNNILTAISGNVDLVLTEPAISPDSRECLTEVNTAVEKAAYLISSLLTFSRKQQMRPVVFDLSTLFPDLASRLPRLLGEQYDISIAALPGTASICTDPVQFEHVLINMVVNARDAMPNGGRIDISARNVVVEPGRDPDRRIDRGVDPGEYVLITVTDTGTGMSPEVMDRIFEPFYTTKAVGKGSGLGLSTAYGIVKESKGHILVQSFPGVGTTFQILLPAVADPTPTGRPGAEARQTTPGSGAPARDGGSAEIDRCRGNESILVVEDNAAIGELVPRLLTPLGYRITIASDGIEALALLERSKGTPFDLLLTDVILPKQLYGMSLFEKARSIAPSIRVLFMSGHTYDALGAKGVLDDPSFFLQKPFTRLELAGKVRSVLDRPPKT